MKLTKKDSSQENDLKDINQTLYQRWEDTKLELKNEFKSIIWNSWVMPLQVLEFKDNKLVILASSELVKNRIQNQYYEQIFLKAKIFFPSLKKISFIIEQNKFGNIKPNKLQTEIKRNFSDTNSISFITSVSKTLDKNNTFNNFVVDETNELAFLSSKKIACNFSNIYNPLYIYGGVGLGKTHLLNSIAWEIKNIKKRQFVLMSAERFMYQFIKALKSKEILKFKEEFRAIDVLMIDDFQFLGGKDSTQEEFFHIFNDMIELNKQIIITADKSPRDINNLDYRIKSRLSGGLTVDILPTNFELRKKIIRSKLISKKAYLENKVVDFLAKNVTTSVRELEGSINKLIAYSELMNVNISLIKTKEVLADLLLVRNKNITIIDIQSEVSKHFNINFSDLCSKKRSRYIARPRQMAMFLCKELTNLSYPEIGKSFGGKDHATVIHGVNKIKELSLSDKKIKNDLENLITNLKS